MDLTKKMHYIFKERKNIKNCRKTCQNNLSSSESEQSRSGLSAF